ncbi:MAG: hypothetical protein QOF02_3474 [Blastocatellia bacterium]|jgi:hypothetical protein|nr:hypothetical protein [Blastocatellia bacterium]
MRAKLAVFIMLCLVALGGAGAAQERAETKANVPAEVIGFDWKYQGYATGETVREESVALSTKTKRAVVYVFKYTARVNLKNLATKTIKTVEWNYLFVDPENEKELKRYKILSKQQILPDAAQTLVKDIFIDLKEKTGHLKTGKQKVQLARIEYTDGSSWRP